MATDEKNVFGLHGYDRQSLLLDVTDEVRNADYFYISSEANKVIALLKDKANYNEYAYKHKSEELADTCRYFEKELRYHKYKRCLRNAESCMNKAWYYTEVCDHNSSSRMWKWNKRWLKIAEQFKEAK